MRNISAAILAACLVLPGCATSYGNGSFSLTGGYEQARVNARLTKVNFVANGYSDAETVQMFALYRCAELARDAGKPYFTIYASLTSAALNRPSGMPLVGSLGNKPSASAYLAMEDGPRPGAKEVAAVLAEYRAKVEEYTPRMPGGKK